MLRLVLLAVALSLGSYAHPQSAFTCPWGSRGACLDYGDKVCSNLGKCVRDDAVCFNSYTCDYKGFICKSKFDEVVDEYDDVVEKHNRLVRTVNSIKDCLSTATSLEQARICAL